MENWYKTGYCNKGHVLTTQSNHSVATCTCCRLQWSILDRWHISSGLDKHGIVWVIHHTVTNSRQIGNQRLVFIIVYFVGEGRDCSREVIRRGKRLPLINCYVYLGPRYMYDVHTAIVTQATCSCITEWITISGRFFILEIVSRVKQIQHQNVPKATGGDKRVNHSNMQVSSF
jgi:hypothetical protein